MKYDLLVLEQLSTLIDCSKKLSEENLTGADVKNCDSLLQTSVKHFTELIKMFESGKLSKLKRQDAPLSIKIIPSNERIKIEKAQVAKEIKLARLEMDSPQEEDDDDQQSLSFDHDAGELEDLEGLPQVGYYFENIFGLKEFYLYRAVTFIQLKKFTEAISDFNSLRKLEEKDLMFSMTLRSEKS